MSTPQSPFMDHAGPILQGDPSLSDAAKANIWDVFHQSKNPSELADKLQNMPHPDQPGQTLVIPDDTKHKLWTAKQASMPAPPPLDKVSEAIQRMVALPPETLDKAEQHPQVLKAFTTAATTPEKPAAEPASTSSTAPKGSTSSAAPKAPKTPPAPRPDGQPHFPAIDPTMHRILASNGGVYDVPKDRIDDARKTDPLLHVLNPDE